MRPTAHGYARISLARLMKQRAYLESRIRDDLELCHLGETLEI
ncbi:hypothetical protein [Bradyrhizobium hipponense]|nr:hypothetical protein [Bradyrhizobium hipponense]